jgi:hypothetical protein
MTLSEGQDEQVDPQSLHEAAWNLYKQGRFAEADKYIRLAAASGLSDPEFLYHAGLIAYAVGRKDEALELVKGALALARGQLKAA